MLQTIQLTEYDEPAEGHDRADENGTIGIFTQWATINYN
jgi:hypothetical protein